MGKHSASIKESIKIISGANAYIGVNICSATVATVDEDGNFCTVNSVDGSKNIDGMKVSLMLEEADGELNVPEIGSTIIVCYTDFTKPFMVDYTWLTKKLIIVGNSSYEINEEEQIFNGKGFGGIPIVKNPENSKAGLLKKITQLEQQVNDILNKLKGIVIPLAPSGTYPFAPEFLDINTILPLTTEKDISNPDIFHDKKYSK